MNFGAKTILLGMAATLMAAGAANAQAAGDATKGAATFKQQCSVCHSAGEPGVKPGPMLKGVVGRKAGSVAGFKYSPALPKSGKTWTEAELDPFLTAPTKVVPGTFMVIPVANPQTRADVIAYLKTLK